MAADAVARAGAMTPPTPGAHVRLTTERILALPATWFHVEAVFHFLWGKTSAGQYDKLEWSAYHELLKRWRERLA